MLLSSRGSRPRKTPFPRTGRRIASRSLRILSILCSCAVLAWAWRGAPAGLTRGPYLQASGATTVKLVCRTSAETVVTLRYGRHAGPPWERETSSASGTTHVFELADLRPERRYAYELSAAGCVLASGDSFRTAPPEQSRAPFRFLAWGDSGTGDSTQLEVAARMKEVRPVPDFALGLGDLVYEDGQWEGYDPRLFAPYAGLFRRMTFWPTLGNHDVVTEDGAPYLDAFHLPTDSGAPGHPSGTERYYSFDHGLAHFTCADSESSSSEPGSPMYSWLADDLEDARARGKRWLFVFMHHPPYSHGSHDSDQEQELITLHDNLVPLFESQGVDLVLTGHSHVYERSYLARDDAILQTDPNEYAKIGSPDGTLYLVSGCGGKSDTGTLDHPLMATSYGDVAGFNVFDVSWEQVRGRFVERDGRTTDLFTLHKAVDVTPPGIAAVEARAADRIAVVFDEPVQGGSGPSGAENTGNYQFLPPLAVEEATLDSDQRTVLLTTSELLPDRVHELSVLEIADPAGNRRAASARFARAQDGSFSESAVVPRGGLWLYLAGSSAPPDDWASGAFDDRSWPEGPAGFGYADADDATVLQDMRNNYLTVYLRTSFEVLEPSEVAGLGLNVSFDDGFVAYLNGTEIARVNVPLEQTSTTPASDSHEAGAFEAFDLRGFRCLLTTGTNVLAVEGHNVALDNSDFSLHPELLLTRDGAGGPPVAVLDERFGTANVPARIPFSGARSHDPDGPLAAVAWDFGDGSPVVVGEEVEHLYDRAGLFTATLLVAGDDGQQAIDQVPIRIHEQGEAPLASLSADALGAAVAFDAGGSLDPDGGPLHFDWEFDDPASGPADRSTDIAPVHVFATAGPHTVRLTVIDDEGSGATAMAIVNVSADGGSGGGGGGGGGCSIARQDTAGRRGDPSLALGLAVVLLVLVWRRAWRRSEAHADPPPAASSS